MKAEATITLAALPPGNVPTRPGQPVTDRVYDGPKLEAIFKTQVEPMCALSTSRVGWHADARADEDDLYEIMRRMGGYHPVQIADIAVTAYATCRILTIVPAVDEGGPCLGVDLVGQGAITAHVSAGVRFDVLRASQLLACLQALGAAIEVR